MGDNVNPEGRTAAIGVVLLVGNYSNRTGYAWNNIFRLFEHIASELRSHGGSAWVSFAEFEAPLDWEHAGAIDGVLELPPAPRAPAELLRWVRAIRLHKIRSIYLTDHGFWAWQYAIFRLAGVKRIIIHCRISVADPMPATPSKGPVRWAKWLLARTPLICADKCYAVSDFVRNRLIKKAQCPESRVDTILNGIDLARFSPSLPGDGAHPIKIFCGGRATRHKGVHVLIQAAALLRDQQQLNDFHVVFAGDGPDLDYFKRMADDLKLQAQFQFLGQVGSTEEFVRTADIVVVPSIWGDACPSSISEALAAGKPLVATRVGGVPELIGDDGAALMTEPGNSADLAKALAELCRDPELRRQIGLKARARAELALDQRRYHEQVVGHLIRDLVPSHSDSNG